MAEGTMRAVLLTGENQVSVENIPIPVPASGQVLVKIEASPINPSDLLFIEGKYPTQKPKPSGVGFEGSGTVVSSGGGFLGWTLINKRVAVFSDQYNKHGCWAEYLVTEAKTCLRLRDTVTFDQGSCYFVNPLTVLMFMDMIKTQSHKSVVHTAAASALGKMLLRKCLRENVPLINIVRRQEQVETLQELGAVYVLNSSEPDFQEQLRQLTERLNTTIAFDAVGGSMTGTLFNALRPNGKVYVYGILSGEEASGLNPSGLVFHGKSVEGAYVSTWLNSLGVLKFMSTVSSLNDLVSTDLKSDFSRSFSIDQVGEAIEFYRNNMSAGKVLIKPKPQTS